MRKATRAEHPGRSMNPVIKVADLAWLEFEKPDLARTEAFAHAFGFATALRTDTELMLRGADPGSPCVIVHRGGTSRLRAVAFTAAERADVLRLADAVGARVRPLPETSAASPPTSSTPAGCRYVSSPTPIGWNPYPVRPRTPSTSATAPNAPTPPNGHLGHRPPSSDWGTSFSRARNIVRRWTGTWIISG